MKTERHTPGPWSIGPIGNVIGWIDSEREQRAVEVAGNVSKDDMPQAVREANARLIAAAPELLDSLRHTLDIVEFEHGSTPEYQPLAKWARAIEKARAAIAKAVPSI